jgi:hypothetical protein
MCDNKMNASNEKSLERLASTRACNHFIAQRLTTWLGDVLMCCIIVMLMERTFCDGARERSWECVKGRQSLQLEFCGMQCQMWQVVKRQRSRTLNFCRENGIRPRIVQVRGELMLNWIVWTMMIVIWRALKAKRVHWTMEVIQRKIA